MKIPPSLRPYMGRIVLTFLGLVIGILFLTLGFWKTILLVILCAIGYLVGKWKDGVLDLSWLPRNPWRR